MRTFSELFTQLPRVGVENFLTYLLNSLWFGAGFKLVKQCRVGVDKDCAKLQESTLELFCCLHVGGFYILICLTNSWCLGLALT